jgi:Tfp pilus assembly protein PilE
MALETKRSGLSLVELIITVLILALLMGFAWKFYFGGRETMRHTVSQSQVQADTRIFLDHLETEMASAYSFYKVDSEKKVFGFYSFVFARTTLDDILYDASGRPQKSGTDSPQKIKTVRYEYAWNEDGTVTKTREPGWLYFLQKPMKFEKGNDSAYIAAYKSMEKKVLKNIVDFGIRGYIQKPDKSQTSGFKYDFVDTAEKAADTSFITLRIHTQKDEANNRRDEELDIVTKFYCKTKLAETANPGYFCSTDNDGKY